MKNKDIIPLNENNQPHGYWEEYYENGQLCSKGNYVDGKPHGYWEEYYYNGGLMDKTYYI